MKLFKKKENINYSFNKFEYDHKIIYQDNNKTIKLDERINPHLIKTTQELNKNIIFPNISFIFWYGKLNWGLVEKNINFTKKIGQTKNTMFSIGVDEKGIIWYKKKKEGILGELKKGDVITIGIDYFSKNFIFIVICSKKILELNNKDEKIYENLEEYINLLNNTLKDKMNLKDSIKTSLNLKMKSNPDFTELHGGVNLNDVSKISLFNEEIYQDNLLFLFLQKIVLNDKEKFNDNLIQSNFEKKSNYDKNIELENKTKIFNSSIKMVLNELKNIGCLNTYNSVIDYFYLGNVNDEIKEIEKKDNNKDSDIIYKIRENFKEKKYLKIVEENEKWFENDLNSKLILYILHFIDLFFKDKFEELVYFSQKFLNDYKDQNIKVKYKESKEEYNVSDFMKIISMTNEEFVDSKFSKILNNDTLVYMINKLIKKNKSSLRNLIKNNIILENILNNKFKGYFGFYNFN